MNQTNFDRESVERLARSCSADVAAALRALLVERDALRIVVNIARAEIAAAYHVGAEAMRDAIKARIKAHSFDLKNSGPKTEALAAIDATPLPEIVESDG